MCWFSRDGDVIFPLTGGHRSCVFYKLHSFAVRRPDPSTHLVGHQVGQQHHVPPVNAHAMVDHRVLDFVDDSRPGSFYAQSFLHLQRARMNGSSHYLDATLLLRPPLPYRFPASPTHPLFSKWIFSGEPRANGRVREARQDPAEAWRGNQGR